MCLSVAKVHKPRVELHKWAAQGTPANGKATAQGGAARDLDAYLVRLTHYEWRDEDDEMDWETNIHDWRRLDGSQTGWAKENLRRLENEGQDFLLKVAPSV